MSIREQIFHHLEAIEASGDIGSLNAAIWAWLKEVDEADRHLAVLEQKLAASRAVISMRDKDAEIDTSLGFEPLSKEQRLQRLDERWAHYQHTGRSVSHEAMKDWAASLAPQQ